MNIHEISTAFAELGIKHVVVSADYDEATALQVHYNSSSDRLRERKLAKKYRQKNKSKLKLKAKKYRLKMKHRKPDRTRSQRAKLIHKHYKY